MSFLCQASESMGCTSPPEFNKPAGSQGWWELGRAACVRTAVDWWRPCGGKPLLEKSAQNYS